MVKDYEAALQFVQDYFQIDFKKFISKYFQGERAAEITRNITPEKYHQLFGELSDIQREIIDNNLSKFIVVAAGPGSGKTRVLVHKLAALLLMEDVKHEQLLMLTFSRSAATEFKKRLIELIGNAAAFVDIKTFHSYCFDLLGKIGSLEGVDDVVKDATRMINDGEVELGRITKTVLVIDEAQDMDKNEFALIEALMRRNENMRVIAVGDDDQNIYEFRGSDSRYLKSLISEYAAFKYEMTENYRSCTNIVALSNAFATGISDRMKSAPGEAVRQENGIVQIIQHTGTNLEEPVVNQLIATYHQGSACVLTNTNDEALRVMSLLIKRGIRAKLIQSNDGFQLFNLAEIRFFFKIIDIERTSPVISDSLWQRAKERLQNTYRDSSCLTICCHLIADFEETNRTKYWTDLMEFVKESKLEDFYEDHKGTVLVSTIHKAKGREFDNVYMLLNQVGVFSVK
jgi:ATP-dependent DNA helicase RecQ